MAPKSRRVRDRPLEARIADRRRGGIGRDAARRSPLSTGPLARQSTDPSDSAQVTAAGGIVVRESRGELSVAVVHRPKYMDWSLPKGKLEPGEKFREAALREVSEEAGLACEVEDELSPIHYVDRKGRTKIVRYWLMRLTAEPGEFEPNDEVDELRWLTRPEAEELLTYDHDRALVAEAFAARQSDPQTG